MIKLKSVIIIFIVSLLSLSIGCKDDKKILLFSIEDDIKLGQQVADQIAGDESFIILSESEYSEAYSYLNNMKNEILNSGNVTYKNQFAWKLHIIHDDAVLNAFATPGGYIYIYTGLIKYLDKEDDLAGVLGHEIAHADQRHSSKQMQQQYGIGLLLSIITGSSESEIVNIAGQFAGTLAGLAFSRSDESEADEYSVIYLSNTKYACNGAYTFFQKLLDAGSTGGTPAFLSTHPNPADRVEDINTKAIELNCDTTPVTPPTYEDLKTSLPQ